MWIILIFDYNPWIMTIIHRLWYYAWIMIIIHGLWYNAWIIPDFKKKIDVHPLGPLKTEEIFF